ncbi:COG4223 family protein [Pseudomonadota bacterium]
MAALERIAASDDVVAGALMRLRTNADVGVPTEGALTGRFEAMAREIMHARAQGADAGWMGRVKDSLGGLVTVRRTDPGTITDEVERAVAVAEAALQLGDLKGAVDALGVLQGTPGDAAAAWLGDARARLDAEEALETLHNHALAVLSSAGGN